MSVDLNCDVTHVYSVLINISIFVYRDNDPDHFTGTVFAGIMSISSECQLVEMPVLALLLARV